MWQYWDHGIARLTLGKLCQSVQINFFGVNNANYVNGNEFQTKVLLQTELPSLQREETNLSFSLSSRCVAKQYVMQC